MADFPGYAPPKLKDPANYRLEARPVHKVRILPTLGDRGVPPRSQERQAASRPDNASTNGTWLGVHLVSEAQLTPGARLRVGSTEFVIVDEDRRADDDMIGSSEALSVLRDQINVVARCRYPLHLHGESGTGKELAARAIHLAELTQVVRGRHAQR